MAQYTVTFSTYASTFLTVEAESAEDARQLADDQFEAPFICAQCSGWGNGPSLELGDAWEQDESDGGVWES